MQGEKQSRPVAHVKAQRQKLTRPTDLLCDVRVEQWSDSKQRVYRRRDHDAKMAELTYLSQESGAPEGLKQGNKRMKFTC